MSDFNLSRSKEGKIVAGVCSGLAKNFETDVNLIRLTFVAATLICGVSILSYLILWLFLGYAETAPKQITKKTTTKKPSVNVKKAEEVSQDS